MVAHGKYAGGSFSALSIRFVLGRHFSRNAQLCKGVPGTSSLLTHDMIVESYHSCTTLHQYPGV